jgi:hypothetical protein
MFGILILFAALTPHGDLESLGYMISELFYGSLPWASVAEELVAADLGCSAAALRARAGARILALKQSSVLFPDFPGIFSVTPSHLITISRDEAVHVERKIQAFPA